MEKYILHKPSVLLEITLAYKCPFDDTENPDHIIVQSVICYHTDRMTN